MSVWFAFKDLFSLKFSVYVLVSAVPTGAREGARVSRVTSTGEPLDIGSGSHTLVLYKSRICF